MTPTGLRFLKQAYQPGSVKSGTARDCCTALLVRLPRKLLKDDLS